MQVGVTTTTINSDQEREHFSIINECGFGIMTCTNPPVGVGFKHIGATKFGKLIYGCPAIIGENNIVTDATHKISKEEAILFTKSSFADVSNNINCIEATNGKTKIIKFSRSDFIMRGGFSETLMTPHFSNEEIKMLKNSGLYNDYFTGG